MKGVSILAASAALLGAANAGVHKMKLKKVPLTEQLVSIPSKSSIAVNVLI